MSQTNDLIVEIKHVMDDYWSSYFEGDLERWAEYLDQDYRNIGSSEEEIWNSKAEIVDYSYRVIDQMKGVVELRNKVSDVIKYDPYFMVHEYGDMFVQLNGKWNFYQKFRLSTLMQKSDDRWIILQQHGSFPDSKIQEGEAIGKDALKAENERLRRAVEERTFELERRNKMLEIEGALQRIRAQATGMKKSEDLLDVVVAMRSEFIALGHEAHYFWHMLWSPNHYEKAMTSGDGRRIGFVMKLPRHIHGDIPLLSEWEVGDEQTVVYAMDAEEAIDYVHKMVTLGDFQHIDPNAPTADDIRSIGGLTFIMARTTHGEIGYSLPGVVKHPPQSDLEILVQFAEAFDLAHLRFLDLKKAENQALEVQVQLGLEKVRSRTMAMTKSEELPDAANVLFLEIQSLGIPAWSCGYNILSPDMKSTTCIMSSEGKLQHPFILPLMGETSFLEWYDFVQNDQEILVQELGGTDLEEHYDYMKSLPDLEATFQQIKDYGLALPTYQINHLVKCSFGFLLFITYEKVPNAIDIFRRFAAVFEQTYVRFLDLKKAEAQAREAQIEAALERVRSKAIGMRSGEDIGAATNIMFNEIENLGIETMRCGVLIIHENMKMDVWTTSATDEDTIINVSGHIDMTAHSLFENIYLAWKAQDDHIQFELSGEYSKAYYQAMREGRGYNLPAASEVFGTHYNTVFIFKEGALFFFTRNVLSTKAIKTLQRFAKVFGLTYQRYRELLESEKRENEAKKQSSLDRVRGEIASMRSTEDLNRITPIVWQELTNLGVPFFRCGIFIMNEETKGIDVYLSAPDGKSLGVMILNYETNDITKNSVEFWRNEKVYKVHWNKAEFMDWTNLLIKLDKIENKLGYQGGHDAPESLYLHFIPFLQGMLYVGHRNPLNEEQIELVKNLSESFSVAYSRYEDFVKLEKAKLKVEETLTNLKSTQNQLIQSEKMASLGELTAGIAHEIQNPLNFVNNFAELSTELLQEMNEEIKSGEFEEAKAIAKDIEQNLQKISHHGKRADGIVKGMLQHSRKSTATKELVHINKLTDEFLRLAYHGLRAKDKSFNAKLITEYDDTVGNVPVIAQDMGRVILNIITNAFHAVNEKKLEQSFDFEPTVSVSTSKSNGHVVIDIADNGKGIPDEIKDKIFQPFFTTKPTGEGTGLGLSLAFDIVTKGHGGLLNVETKDGNGSKFSILIPCES
ncbi:ATP-binding protein [Portibacter marinus]|uniref:ATP-binding protein n=1 Tax=Portibacter marinus TaxID=2898660 RepID=UPI001F364CFF|nr:ATP-binding protein [Portibacter marinus]